VSVRAVSLFSGAGGLDWGLREAGFRILFANDVNSAAASTYAANFELKLEVCRRRGAEAQAGIALACDVEHVDFSPLEDAGVDVVAGGPPCQDFSIVRGPDWDRRGIEVKRGRLYLHFVRALSTLKPRAFIFENVPGLVTANKGLAYRVIREDFQRAGYELVFSDVVDLSVLGVPQRRERLIIVGVRRDLLEKIEDLWSARAVFEGALKTPFRSYPLTAMEALEGRPLPELRAEYEKIMRSWAGVWDEVGTEAARRWRQEVWDGLTFDAVRDYCLANKIGHCGGEELELALNAHREVLRELGYLGVRASELRLPDGTTDLPADSPDVLERLRRIPPGENHEFVRGTKWEVEGRGISLVYRRLHPLKPSYTIVAYGGGGTHGYHYERSRGTLTLRERARLQTFPDRFLFKGSKTEIRAQIGEAVPPLAAKRLGEALRAVLEALTQA
jgi:DNA (cytosine-5)-methyltransferase 1